MGYNQTWGQALSKGLKSKPKALSKGLDPMSGYNQGIILNLILIRLKKMLPIFARLKLWFYITPMGSSSNFRAPNPNFFEILCFRLISVKSWIMP